VLYISIILAAIMVSIALIEFANSGVAQGQVNYTSSSLSLTPEQKDANM
jgi:hypothetical protein